MEIFYKFSDEFIKVKLARHYSQVQRLVAKAEV